MLGVTVEKPLIIQRWFEASEWDVMLQGRLLFRGFSKEIDQQTLMTASPKHRTPVNMPPHVQVEMDDWFEGSFGIRYRQRSIFATGSFDNALGYAGTFGEVRKIRPTGPFCICWSPYVVDLYIDYQNISSQESLTRFLARQHFSNEDLGNAAETGHEIMLVGDAFACEKIR